MSGIEAEHEGEAIVLLVFKWLESKMFWKRRENPRAERSQEATGM